MEQQQVVEQRQVHGTTTKGTAARIGALPLASDGGAGGNRREFTMPRGGYADVNWFVRAARVVPVIAGAALVGGMIGGFAMFAIDSALTWEPVSQPRPDARTEGEASAVVTQPNKPVRIVGGAIPDPSAGMSAPVPAPQPRNTASSAHISPQLLTPKPLGPASQLQPQTATTGSISSAPIQSPAPAATQLQSRWPDALSRAHQNAANAANANSAQQQTAPPVAAQTTSERAATSDDQDRGKMRYGRHSRRHWRGDDDAWASSSRRQDARTYDRLYDSYGNRRDSSYSNPREQFNGDARDQDDSASRSDLSRAEMRRLRHETRYRSRRQSDDNDRGQAFEGNRQQSEPFWGGGSFRRGDGYRDND
jgi:hypothetical protein